MSSRKPTLVSTTRNTVASIFPWATHSESNLHQVQKPYLKPGTTVSAEDNDDGPDIFAEQAQTIENLQAALVKYKNEVARTNRGMERKRGQLQGWQEEYTNLESTYDALQEEYTKLESINKIQEAETHDLQQSLIVSHLESHRLSRRSPQTQELREELERAKVENGALSRLIEKYQSQIEEYKNQIFKMQPDDNVSDVVVAQKYEELQVAVSDWVDTELKDASGYLRQDSLAALGQTARAQVERAFMLGNLQTALDQSDAEPLLTEMVIARYLHDHILKDSVHFLGLQTATEDTLTFIEQEIKNAEPVKGKMAPFQS